jgi:hypothetical protein
MQISDEDRKRIQELEESLWISETRFDREYMEGVLSSDFFEFGRSGRLWKREETLAAPFHEINATIPLKDFAVHPISDDVVLVTYVSELHDEVLEVGNRSSLWVRTPKDWQLRFHQGTKVV